MLKKIAVTGPECSGKTTLCRALAVKLNCLWVPEMARIILENDGPNYDAAKVESMARLQVEEEKRLTQKAIFSGHNWLICDTDMIVYKIWMEERFGFCPVWINEAILNSDYTLTLLLRPDLEWKEDPLRENSHNRDVLLQRYKIILKDNSLPWKEISGVSRESMALDILTGSDI